MDRNFYIKQSFQNAFPADGWSINWNPANGFAANRAVMLAVYNYYRDLLNYDDKLWWAGLGRMAGGAVYGGLVRDGFGDSTMTPDTGLFRRTMVKIGKDIFLDIAWQHEVYRQCKDNLGGNFDELFRLTRERDQSTAPTDPTPEPGMEYEQAWRLITKSGATDADLAAGNKILLRNEQKIIIQPNYDMMKAANETSFVMSKLGVFTPNIHPYHLSFTLAMGTSVNVVDFDPRWTWITKDASMLDNWCKAGNTERRRLANLPMEPDIINQRWGQIGRPDLLPPGAPGDDD